MSAHVDPHNPGAEAVRAERKLTDLRRWADETDPEAEPLESFRRNLVYYRTRGIAGYDTVYTPDEVRRLLEAAHENAVAVTGYAKVNPWREDA